MANKCFDIHHVRHLGECRNGVPNLNLMDGVQFQKLLNGFSGPWIVFMEGYKSFIRFANLDLYPVQGQRVKGV